MTPPIRRSLACAALMLAATVTGLLWRMAPLHLPWLWFKYGGSALWAVALYWLVAACLPRSRPTTLALMAAIIALAVEFSRLIPSAALEAFRETLAGRLLLGRYFGWRNILAYWLAILTAAILDRLAHPGRTRD